MNTLLLILAIVCLLVGVIGSVAPGLPGPPISWVGLLLLALSHHAIIAPSLLITTAVVAIIITALDYIVPTLGTKRFGGSKYGMWGCNIGLIVSIVGLPFGPQGLLGVIVWPFIGALVGEYLHSHDFTPSLRAAWGAFLGFLGGTLLKLFYCIALIIIALAKLF